MAPIITKLHGIIHGKTIELKEDPGLREGLEVEVVIQTQSPLPSWGEGIRRSAGAIPADPQDDLILDEIHAERRRAHLRGTTE